MQLEVSSNRVGKVVLTQTNNGEYALWQNIAQDYDWWIATLQNVSPQQILVQLDQLSRERDFIECFGFHKDIQCVGLRRGGGLALVLSDKIFFASESQAFGAMRRSELEIAVTPFLLSGKISECFFSGL
jgi:hypothetical protein